MQNSNLTWKDIILLSYCHQGTVTYSRIFIGCWQQYCLLTWSNEFHWAACVTSFASYNNVSYFIKSARKCKVITLDHTPRPGGQVQEQQVWVPYLLYHSIKTTHTHIRAHTDTDTGTDTHTWAHTHIQTHSHAHAHTHTRTRTHQLVHTRTHTHMHACTHTHARTHAHTHIHTHTDTHTHAHTHAHTYIHTRTHTHTHTTHTHTYTLGQYLSYSCYLLGFADVFNLPWAGYFHGCIVRDQAFLCRYFKISISNR